MRRSRTNILGVAMRSHQSCRAGVDSLCHFNIYQLEPVCAHKYFSTTLNPPDFASQSSLGIMLTLILPFAILLLFTSLTHAHVRLKSPTPYGPNDWTFAKKSACRPISMQTLVRQYYPHGDDSRRSPTPTLQGRRYGYARRRILPNLHFAKHESDVECKLQGYKELHR